MTHIDVTTQPVLTEDACAASASLGTAEILGMQVPSIKSQLSQDLHATLQAATLSTIVEKSSFVRHVALFSFANLIALACNGVLTFLLPRLLSMEGYGYYRLFILYGGFAGILHMGLLDGSLIRWAARPQPRMKAELFSSLVFLLLQHLLLLGPATVILLAAFRHQPWFFLTVAVVVYALVWNTATLGQFALQAGKSFGYLSVLTVINPALLLGFVLTANHWKHLTLEMLLAAYIGSWLLAVIALWAVLLVNYRAHIRSVRHVWQVGRWNVQVGWSVLLALLLTNIVLALDRIVVSMSFSIRDFAIYSLAANALAVVNTIILSISRVVFPYLSDISAAGVRMRAYTQGEAVLMSLWGLGLTGYFPLRVLIARLLPAYVPSLPILRLLMLATGLTASIYILHANYFRSHLRQGKLLLGVSVGLLAAGFLLTIARHTGNLVNMSWAMLAAVAIWWVTDELLLRELTGRSTLEIGKALFFTAAGCALLLFSSSIRNSLLGVMTYCAATGLLTLIMYGSSLRMLSPSGQTAPSFSSSE